MYYLVQSHCLSSLCILSFLVSLCLYSWMSTSQNNNFYLLFKCDAACSLLAQGSKDIDPFDLWNVYTQWTQYAPMQSPLVSQLPPIFCISFFRRQAPRGQATWGASCARGRIWMSISNLAAKLKRRLLQMSAAPAIHSSWLMPSKCSSGTWMGGKCFLRWAVFHTKKGPHNFWSWWDLESCVATRTQLVSVWQT